MKRRPSFSVDKEWLIERIVRHKKQEKPTEKKEAEESVIVFSPLTQETDRRVVFLVEEAPLDDNYPQGTLLFYDGSLWYKSGSGWKRGVKVTISTSFPASPETGDICFRTDENVIYIYDGTNWNREASIKLGTTLPFSHQSGDIFFHTTEKQFYVSDGTNWNREASIKAGTTFPAFPQTGDIFFHTNENRFYLYDGSNWRREPQNDAGTSFPSSPQKGDIFYRTDERQFYVYDGSNWKREQINSVASSFPASPIIGDICYRSDEGKFYIYNGTSWLPEAVGSGGGGSGVGFGTSFPSSPSDGQLFYRTDLKRLFAYNASASQWVAQEAIQTSAPASPVTGEMWLEDSNNRVAVRGTATKYLGYINPYTTELNTVSGNSGTLTFGVAPANRRGRIQAGLAAGLRTLNTDHIIGIDQNAGMLYVNGFYSGGSGNRFVEIPAQHFMRPVLTNKSVSAGNNDIEKAEHPQLYVDCLDYKVLVTESSQVDFYGHFVTPAVYRVGTPALNYFRGMLYIFLKGQASFTYQLSHQLIVYDINNRTAVQTTTETNFSIATDTNGNGYSNIDIGALVGSSTNRNIILILRLKRRRSAESVGTRPDDCYIACSFVGMNWNG